MFHRSMKILCLLALSLSIRNALTKSDDFTCPKDGRWPHPVDCEKYYTCNSGISIEGWCGTAMTYDPDHQRCDLSKNIECRNGERPTWTPPEGWGQSDSVTSYVVTKTTASSHDDERDEGDGDEEEKKTRATKKHKTTARAATPAAKLAAIRVTMPIAELVENSACTFQGNMPDPNNCQSYYTCADDVIALVHCPERQLFDEDVRSCNDFRKVFCANRPTNERDIDPCAGQNNGWYADLDTQCRSYHLCGEQRRTKMGECPLGSKWNSARLRCDDPKNIVAPCGLRTNRAVLLFSDCYSRIATICLLLTFQQIVVLRSP